MYSKRGGRVAVNRMQFQDLVYRVQRLEEEASDNAADPETSTLTKPDVIKKLKELNIDHNPRDKKYDLIELLPKDEELCQNDQME